MVNPKLIALLPDLASFILVVNEGSFTAAAKQLGVTPSALSKLITRLEQALNVKLFERTTRSRAHLVHKVHRHLAVLSFAHC